MPRGEEKFFGHVQKRGKGRTPESFYSIDVQLTFEDVYIGLTIWY